jgi:hypothetical protein
LHRQSAAPEEAELDTSPRLTDGVDSRRDNVDANVYFLQ